MAKDIGGFSGLADKIQGAGLFQVQKINGITDVFPNALHQQDSINLLYDLKTLNLHYYYYFFSYKVLHLEVRKCQKRAAL